MKDIPWDCSEFDNPSVARAILAELAHDISDDSLSFIPRLVAGAVRTPLPDDILNKIHRLSKSVISRPSLFRLFGDYPPVVDRLVRLFSTSHYLSEIIIRDSEMTSLLINPDTSCRPTSLDWLAGEFKRILDNPVDNPARKLDRMRVTKRRELLRIGIRDYLLDETFDRVLEQISILADATIQAVLSLNEDVLAARHGRPASPFVVIALGKLGGNELNYSSDVDLIFVYDQEGTVGRITHHEFFNDLAGMAIASLSTSTREGLLYRADARLRPDGQAGPLARSQTSMMRYYENRGQLWERQMLIKARPVAGDVSFGEKFLSQLQPFVYPRTFLTSPLDEIARMKWRIEDHRRHDVFNVKTSPGGIRDIEFIVQALQLLHGGPRRELRTPNTLDALIRLRDAGLLTAAEYDTLRDAYVWYRQVEHLLQIDQDLQTHTISDTPAQWRRLAMLTGFQEPRVFQDVFARTRVKVREFYDAFFFAKDTKEHGDLMGLLGTETISKEQSLTLERMGFQMPDQAHRALRSLHAGEFPHLNSNSERSAFENLAGKLMDDIRTMPDPDHTISNLARILSPQRFKDQFYQSLLEKDILRRVLVHFSALSPSVTNILCDRPSFLGFVESHMPDWAVDRPATQNAALEIGDWYALKDMTFLKLLIKDTLGFIDQDQLHQALTELAQEILKGIFDEVFSPDDRVAVIAMGKLGGRELSFRSDLDVIFVCDNGRAVDSLIAKAKDFLNLICRITPSGKLYDIDARLRPEGKQAPLVVTIDRYRSYYATRAMTWEIQALIKARLLLGHEKTSKIAMELLEDILWGVPWKPSQTQEIADMRRRQAMEKAPRLDDVSFEYKYVTGGLLDIEYAVQALQLTHRVASPTTLTALTRLHEKGIVRRDSFETLAHNYRFLREIEKWNFLLFEKRTARLPSDEKQLAFLARFCKLRSTEHLMSSLSNAKNQNRTFFSEVIGKHVP